MGIKQKEENTNGGLHNTLAAGTTVKGRHRDGNRLPPGWKNRRRCKL